MRSPTTATSSACAASGRPARQSHRRAARALSGILLTLAATSLGGCRIADLLTPADEPKAAVVVSAEPPAIRDSAVAGRSRASTIRVMLSSDNGEWRWKATERTGSSWLRLGPQDGTLPGPIEVRLVPDGLAPGVYEDTLDFSFPDEPSLALSLPVTYRIQEAPRVGEDDEDDDDDDGDGASGGDCPTVTLVAGTTVTGEVDSDCPSPVRDDYFAQLYRLEGDEGDRVTFVVVGEGFDPRLILYDGAPDEDEILAESASCTGSAPKACIRKERLPRTGAYTLEVSSKKEQKKGTFTLTFAEGG